MQSHHNISTSEFEEEDFVVADILPRLRVLLSFDNFSDFQLRDASKTGIRKISLAVLSDWIYKLHICIRHLSIGAKVAFLLVLLLP